ncbi:magnesium transporter [Thiohalobacter thiocyanaticus]|uniref:Magnesium transporter n=1 Tax=Thiohalobacter thiocyanaticus TaxID=585455 RepID=A0A426QK33_9GAMM|nr:magnesium transporter [Thiohalobacter thiocyanaticus]RRQ22101.1 magnesium transporter [Thiohalobacter thiocyanaticus]
MPQSPGIMELVERIRDEDPAEAAGRLADLPPDEIQFVLSRLPEEQALAVAAHLAESAAPEEAATRAVLSGTEETIGELMTVAPAILPAAHTVAEALAFLVKSTEISEISYIFATESERLVGVVGMRDLLLAKPSQTLADIMVKNPFAFRPDTPVQDAVGEVLYRHYPLYPVIDETGRVAGVVHGWKLYERIATELSTQAGTQYGVAREEQIRTPVLQAFRMRHPWLQVNLITAFAAAFVVGMFEDTITRMVALAAFLPVLAGQSGNTGCQALAITLRGITLGQLRDYPVGQLLRKEILLGALNGAVVGVIAGIAMYGYAVTTDSLEPALLGAVIFLAMIGACVGSGIFGVVVPLTLKRFGADPATASSIFLTTFTDIIGMGLMLFLATALIL